MRLRNAILTLYLLSVILLLTAAGAARNTSFDVHWKDTYWVLDGFVLFMPFAVMLTLVLVILLTARRLMRNQWLMALHAFGTPVLILLFFAILRANSQTGARPMPGNFVNLAETGSSLVLVLHAILYWQLLLPRNFLLSIRQKHCP